MSTISHVKIAGVETQESLSSLAFRHFFAAGRIFALVARERLQLACMHKITRMRTQEEALLLEVSHLAEGGHASSGFRVFA